MFYVIEDSRVDLSPLTPFAVIGGDHHIHSWKFPDPETRIRASLHVLEQGIRHARRLDVPFIVNGDLTHDKNALDPVVTAELMMLFRREKSTGTKIILNVGNHERTEKYQAMHTLACFEPVVDFVASSPHLMHLHKHGRPDLAMNIMLVPFYYNHKQAMADIELQGLWQRCNPSVPLVFVGHYPVDGAEINGIKPHFGIKYEDFQPERFSALLFNDIHKAQPVSEKAFHLGCTHQNTFGEEGYRYGWWVVGLWGNDPNAVTIARLPTEAPEFYTGTEDEVALVNPDEDYVREKPSTVIARTMEKQGAPRIEFTPGDLGSSIDKYLDYQVEQGFIMQPMRDKMRSAVAEIMRTGVAPGAR